jgi:hypothetical protein
MKYFIYSIDYGCTYGESKGGLDFKEAMDIIKCLEKKGERFSVVVQ